MSQQTSIRAITSPRCPCPSRIAHELTRARGWPPPGSRYRSGTLGRRAGEAPRWPGAGSGGPKGSTSRRLVAGRAREGKTMLSAPAAQQEPGRLANQSPPSHGPSRPRRGAMLPSATRPPRRTDGRSFSVSSQPSRMLGDGSGARPAQAHLSSTRRRPPRARSGATWTTFAGARTRLVGDHHSVRSPCWHRTWRTTESSGSCVWPLMSPA